MYVVSVQTKTEPFRAPGHQEAPAEQTVMVSDDCRSDAPVRRDSPTRTSPPADTLVSARPRERSTGGRHPWLSTH